MTLCRKSTFASYYRRFKTWWHQLWVVLFIHKYLQTACPFKAIYIISQKIELNGVVVIDFQMEAMLLNGFSRGSRAGGQDCARHNFSDIRG
jgi:hypothetical protein